MLLLESLSWTTSNRPEACGRGTRSNCFKAKQAAAADHHCWVHLIDDGERERSATHTHTLSLSPTLRRLSSSASSIDRSIEGRARSSHPSPHAYRQSIESSIGSFDPMGDAPPPLLGDTHKGGEHLTLLILTPLAHHPHHLRLLHSFPPPPKNKQTQETWA
jgi:hypothetical protein